MIPFAVPLTVIACAVNAAVHREIWPRMIHAEHLVHQDVADGQGCLAGAGAFILNLLDSR